MHGQGHTAAAAQSADELLRRVRKTLGEVHPIFASILQTRAALARLLGNAKEAEGFYLDALELQLAALPHQYEGYLATSSDLTGFYSRAGDWARVVQIWSRILPPVREFAGVAHPLYAEALNNLA